MQVAELKQKVYSRWCGLYTYNKAHFVKSSPTEDQTFKQEMRSFGDLRRRLTWEKAFSALEAKSLWDFNDDNQFLIEFYLVAVPKKEGWIYLVPQVVEQFIAIPGGLDCLLNGFEQIRNEGCGYGASQSDLKELMHAATEAGRRIGAVEPVRRINTNAEIPQRQLATAAAN